MKGIQTHTHTHEHYECLDKPWMLDTQQPRSRARDAGHRGGFSQVHFHRTRLPDLDDGRPQGHVIVCVGPTTCPVPPLNVVLPAT